LLSPAERERSSTCYSCPLPLALSPAECLLCRRVEADPDICGDKQEKYGLCAHVFCLVSGSGHSLQHSKKRVGLLGFLPRDIQLAVRRAAQKVRAWQKSRDICARTGWPELTFPFSVRLPTWEDNNAFADLGERHNTCNARECLYPGGREEAEEEGPWKLLLCSSCAAEGTHRRCSGLTVRTTHWECDSCAGLGT
uniref:PHF7/G2E3-like PHD zinc finger domain-containing protein n=1 Tax=Cyanistes caeruleus TaxID=156563 RepID=A0A8C0UBN0_CYACU